MSSPTTLESNFMNDFWKFRKHFYDSEDWDQIIKFADQLYDRCNHDPYCFGLIVMCLSDMDCRARGGKLPLLTVVNMAREHEGLRPLTKEEWI